MSEKTIKTKSGIEVVLRESITYGEHRQLTAIYLGKLEQAEMMEKANKKGIEFVVVSIGDQKDPAKIYETFCNLPLADATVLEKEINKVLSPKAEETS